MLLYKYRFIAAAGRWLSSLSLRGSLPVSSSLLPSETWCWVNSPQMWMRCVQRRRCAQHDGPSLVGWVLWSLVLQRPGQTPSWYKNVLKDPLRLVCRELWVGQASRVNSQDSLFTFVVSFIHLVCLERLLVWLWEELSAGESGGLKTEQLIGWKDLRWEHPVGDDGVTFYLQVFKVV